MADCEHQQEAFDLVEEQSNGEPRKLRQHLWRDNWNVHECDLFIQLKSMQHDGLLFNDVRVLFPWEESWEHGA